MVESEKDGDPAATVQGKTEDPAAGRAEADRLAKIAPVTDVQAYIGRQLRAVYDDVAKQPIPDRFLALMQQLEAKGAR